MADLNGGRPVAAGTLVSPVVGLGLGWPARAVAALSVNDLAIGLALGRPARRVAELAPGGAGVLGIAPRLAGSVGLALNGSALLGIVPRLAGCASLVMNGGARLEIAPKLAGCAAGALSVPANRLGIRPLLRGVDMSAMGAANGPGDSAGESVEPMPGVWQAVNLPAGYLGPWLAMLALAGGSVWVQNAGKITIAGRVVIDVTGGDMGVASQAAAQRWIDARYALAAECIGVLALPSGDERDAAISKRRSTAYTAAKRNAKAIPLVADAARRLALVADLNFSLRAV